MNWKALKDGECPKCGASLIQKPDVAILECGKRDCDFTISEMKLRELITKPPRAREPQGDGWERHQI